jgi:hypothetical protein
LALFAAEQVLVQLVELERIVPVLVRQVAEELAEGAVLEPELLVQVELVAAAMAEELGLAALVEPTLHLVASYPSIV